MRFILFVAYVAVGAGLHWLFLGPHIDWWSASSLVVVFGWPFVLASIALTLGLAAYGCFLLAAGVGYLFALRK